MVPTDQDQPDQPDQPDQADHAPEPPPSRSASSVRRFSGTLARITQPIVRYSRGVGHGRMVVACSTFTFRFWWFSIAFIHVICILFGTFSAWIYQWLLYSEMGRTLSFYQITVGPNQLISVSILHAFIAIFHVGPLLYMILCSIDSRELVFEHKLVTTLAPSQRTSTLQNLLIILKQRESLPAIRKRGSVLPPQVTKQQQQLQLQQTTIGFFRRCYLQTIALFDRVFGRFGWFGIEGKYFELGYLVVQCVQIALQTNQAFRYSRWVPRRLFNNNYVALIVINCWLTPLIQHTLVHSPGLQRLLCITIDVGLNFAATVGVPIVLSFTYLSLYDSKTDNLKDEVWYDDRLLMYPYTEFQVVLVNQWMEAIAKVLFSAALLINLSVMKTLLERNPTYDSRPSSFSPVIPSSSSSRNSGTKQRSSPTPSMVNMISAMSETSAGRSPEPPNAPVRPPQWWRRWILVPKLLMMLWGVFVLTMHLYAKISDGEPLCAVQVRPWFRSKPSCALMVIDCHQQGINGTYNELQERFTHVSNDTLQHLVLRHCPSIEMPSELQLFTDLIGLKLYNSTISKWTDEAALTNTLQPNLLFFYGIRVNMTEFPRGLMATDFPKFLGNIEFCVTNLTKLPSTLADSWPHGMAIVFEYSEFEEIPASLKQIRPVYISFAHNKLRKVPAWILEQEPMQSIHMAMNPITTLPENVTSIAKSLERIWLTGTDIQTLPEWMNNAVLKQLEAVVLPQTPFCDHWQTHQHKSLVSFDDYARAKTTIQCILTPDVDVDIQHYPLDIDDRSHQIPVL